MKKNAINIVLGLFVITAFILAGCGGGGGTSTPASTNPANSLITHVGWIFDNAAPDFANNGATCFLNVKVYYSESITTNDIDSFSLTAPNGWYWTISSSSAAFGISSTGKPYICTSIYYGDNPYAFPLAGSWIVKLNLKDGQTSSFLLTFHESGSSTAATHTYLYTKENWAPLTNPSQYIAALGRFPSQGYTVQYSSADGGNITTTGLSAIMTNYLVAEPNAYNLICWLYDVNKVYLGCTNLEYSGLDHSSTNLITSSGELSIVSASTTSSIGNVDLSKVKYIRFVNIDGAQYTPSSYSNLDYRSISSLVTVN